MIWMAVYACRREQLHFGMSKGWFPQPETTFRIVCGPGELCSIASPGCNLVNSIEFCTSVFRGTWMQTDPNLLIASLRLDTVSPGTCFFCSFKVCDLQQGKTYVFRVRAVNASGPGKPSDTSEPVLVEARPGEPLSLSCSAQQVTEGSAHSLCVCVCMCRGMFK